MISPFFRSKIVSRGFTAIEILVSMVVLVLIYMGATSLARNIFVNNSFVQGDMNAEYQVRSAFNMMKPEIRSLAASNTGSYPVMTAATSTFTFYSDVYGDGLRRQIRYFLSGTTLKKGVIKPTGSPLAYTGAETVTDVVHNIANGTSTPIFEYFDGNFTGTSTPLASPVSIASVRLARITIKISRTHMPTVSPLVFTTEVSMRNLKSNL
jgi:prepilin-type N-terminal cleavage/methylation domain-containing protein